MKNSNIYSQLGILVFSVLFLFSACGSGNESEPKTGSDERGDLCELLNEDLVRETFELSADIVLEKDDDDIICSYDWKVEATNIIFYSVSLNFASGGQRDDAAAQAVWESQNESIYKDKNLQEVPGVGDQATWSTLGGGQLRVLADGYIFYVSLSAYPRESAMPTPEMIEIASTIAKAVVDKL